jgi:hypothetical protein
MLTILAHSVTGDSAIQTIVVRASSTDTTDASLTTLYLMDGSTVLDSESVTNTSIASNVTFDLSNISNSNGEKGYVVPTGAYKVLTVLADESSATDNGTQASTTVSSVTYQKPNGGTASLTAAAGTLSAVGNTQYFYSVSPTWTLTSGGTIQESKVNNGAGTGQILYGWYDDMVLSVTPVGGSMVYPTTNEFAATISTTTVNTPTTAATVSRVTVDGEPTVLSEGVPYTVRVELTAATTSVKSGTQSIRFNLTSASSTVNGIGTIQTWGLTNFKSSPLSESSGTL